MVATDWGVGQVLLSIIWIALFFIWIMLLINVFADIFRSHDLSGPGKALWTIFVILFPYLGVFAYVLIRGQKMSEHSHQAALQNEEALRRYLGMSAGTSAADELTKLAALKEQGVIDEAEFRHLKAKILA
jgi:Short C-terminal domain